MVVTIWWPNSLREHYSGRLRCSISHYKVDILRVNPYYELASLQLLTLFALRGTSSESLQSLLQHVSLRGY